MAYPVTAGRGLSARGATFFRWAALAGLAGLSLAGCTSDKDKGLCPSAFAIAPASTLTVFRQNAPQDPSGELYTVSITDVKTKCDFDKKRITTDSEIRVLFKAKRAASNEGGTYNVPYFLAVTRHGDKILTKKLFVAQITFQPGQVSASFEDKIDSTTINIARGAKVGEYAIMAGFQLTQAQLDYNTKMNRYAQ
jgi:hypothetical protein